MIKLKSISKKKLNEKNKQYIIIGSLVSIVVITTSIAVWALFFRETKPVLAPDYAPMEMEDNAKPIDDNSSDDKLEQQEGGGAVSLIYSKNVKVDLSEKKASLLFGNPKKSNQDMMIQIVIQDNVILQSGLLQPGYEVNKLDLFEDVELTKGVYEGKFVVLYYQKDTREKAMIKTEIPLSIEVCE